MKKKIIFVCNGNIHRSVIAEECLKEKLKQLGRSDLEVSSYGLQGTMGTREPKHSKLSEYPGEWKAAKTTLENYKIDISGHSFQKVTPALISEASLVIAMDRKVLIDLPNSLTKQFPEFLSKFHLFGKVFGDNGDVLDPAGDENKESHEAVIVKIFNSINDNVDGILRFL